MSSKHHHDGWNDQCHGNTIPLDILAELVRVKPSLNDYGCSAGEGEMQELYSTCWRELEE